MSSYLVYQTSATVVSEPSSATDTWAFPAGINDAGQLIGFFSVDSNNREEGFIYSNGTYTNIAEPLAGVTGDTRPVAINNLGEVVGNFDAGSSTTSQGFLYDNNSFATISDPLAGVAGTTTLVSINDSGVIIGDYTEGTATSGFVYSNGTYVTIADTADGLGGDTELVGINASGQIVGNYSNGTTTEGFIYADGTFTNVIDPEAGVYGNTSLVGIDAAGEVAGNYSNSVSTDGFIEVGGTFASPFNSTAAALSEYGTLAVLSVNGISASGEVYGQLSPPNFEGTGSEYLTVIDDDDVFSALPTFPFSNIVIGADVEGINDSGIAVAVSFGSIQILVPQEIIGVSQGAVDGNDDTFLSILPLTLSGTGTVGDLLVVSDSFGNVTSTIGTATVTADGDWTLITGTLAAGSNTFAATDLDNTLSLSSVSMSADVTIIDQDVMMVISQGALSGNEDTFSAASGLTLSGAGIAGDILAVSDSFAGTSSVLGRVTVASDGSWTLTTDALFDGTHDLTATDTNQASAAAASASTEVMISDVACYVLGTRIATARGQVRVENLRIGDLVQTLQTGLQPIRWIGQRNYDGRLIAGNGAALPVCFRAGALAEGIPVRDLWVSPGHAICIDGALVHAVKLVNGVSIFQADQVETVSYYHIELARHAIIFAEHCPAETFMDEHFRGQFQNVAEYYYLYPDTEAPTISCLPRLERGFGLWSIRQKLAARAGIVSCKAHGPLCGFIDIAGPEMIAGWVQDPLDPNEPVALDIWAGGQLIGRVLADLFRPDVGATGTGNGYHGFEFTLPLNESRVVHIRKFGDQMLVATISNLRQRPIGKLTVGGRKMSA